MPTTADELSLSDLPSDVDEETYLRVAEAQQQRIFNSPEFLAEERAAALFEWYVDGSWYDVPAEGKDGRAEWIATFNKPLFDSDLEALSGRPVAASAPTAEDLAQAVLEAADARIDAVLGPRASYCARRRIATHKRSTNRFRARGGPCGKPDCEVCAWRVFRRRNVQKWLAAWGDDLANVHVLRIANDRNVLRREVQRAYKKRHSDIPQLNGDLVMFLPGPARGAHPVTPHELGVAIAEAFFGKPEAGSGARITNASLTPDGSAVRQVERDPDPENLSTPVPPSAEYHEGEALTAAGATSVSVDPDTGEITGDVTREAVLPVIEDWRAEIGQRLAEARKAAKKSREDVAWLEERGFPLIPSPPRSVLDAIRHRRSAS